MTVLHHSKSHSIKYKNIHIYRANIQILLWGPITLWPFNFTTKWSLFTPANNNTLPISRGFVNVALGAEKEQPISKNFNAEEVHKNGVQTASFHKLWTERDHVKTLFLQKKNSTVSLHFVFHDGMQANPSRLCTFLK